MSWTSPHTFVALAAMAFGDGMADVVGSTVRKWYFQLKPKTWFTKRKSLPGSAACFVSTVVMAFVWQNLAVVCGSSGSSSSSRNGGGKTVVELLSLAHIVKVATIATLVELLPFEDNYVVPFTALAASRALAAQ